MQCDFIFDSLWYFIKNATNVIKNFDKYFITKCDESLLQIATDFLLQNAIALLQFAIVITKCAGNICLVESWTLLIWVLKKTKNRYDVGK